MDNLPAGATQSWFVVKVAVALSPILIFWAADGIGWFLRCTLWRSEVAAQSGEHPHDELAETRRSSRSPPPARTEPASDLNEGRTACQRSSNQVVRKMALSCDGGQSVMDSLPEWASWITAVAVGVSPGMLILLVRPIARLLHRVLWPRPQVVPQPGHEFVRGEPASLAAPPV